MAVPGRAVGWGGGGGRRQGLTPTGRVRLHQVSVPTQSQRCDDAGDTALIEINEMNQNGVATHFGAMSQASSQY